jgi:hypothetical protein
VGGNQVDNERDVLLRRRIQELVRARVSLLEQDISRLQREVNDSFNSLLERADVTTSLPDEDAAFAQIAAEVTAQIDSAGAESVRLGADIALLRDSVAELDGQRTQAEVLNALVARAANFAPRVVLFVIKGGNAVAWAARGLDDANNSIRGMSIPLQSDTVLRAAFSSQQTFYGSPDLQSENQSLLGRLGRVHPQRVLAVPLKVRSKTAALIYADSADSGEVATNVEAIELLGHTAGLVVELVSLRARTSEGAPQPAQPKPPVTPEPVAKPIPASESPVRPPEVQPTRQPVSDFSSHREPPVAPAPHVAPVAPTPDVAPSYFRPTTQSDVPPPMPAPPAAPSVGVTGDEEKAHNDARRFARLLVSEIKLYNEQKVGDGRRTGDLYDRLKEDIDRSRQMYEKRVTPSVAAKFDYFYDELVSTLAEGDPSKLGSDCPGPSVAVGV